jgi:pyruvate dehydrogenase E2 component (dihydrolipoamide acetyltransferase)
MEIRIPHLGEGADSGIVAAIFVKEGDRVSKDQPILELESEKAVASIPSSATGVITKIHVKEGDEVKVGQAIASLSEDGAGASESTTGAAEPGRATQDTTVLPAEPPGRISRTEAAGEEGTAASGLRAGASPSVRRMARELGIDLTKVRGSERGGRIVLADLRKYVQDLQEVAFQQKEAPRRPAAPVPQRFDFSRWGPVTRKKMSATRRAISAKMLDSWTTIPHVTQFDEADISDVLALRKKYLAAYEKHGAHLTLTAFILHALTPLLQKYPLFNSSLDELTDEIIQKGYYHIGIAVDTDHGLIVPVIRDVNKKTLLELSVELQNLAERTRKRSVTLEEMQGATFTLSNQGGIGGGHFTPIINKPEAAVLGIGRGIIKNIPRNGSLQIRTMLPLALSYDHRLIDGADAARFMMGLVQALESFAENDVHLANPNTD